MDECKKHHILVIGAGNFGTCLANHLAIEGHSVDILSRSESLVDGINIHHKNPKYLSTFTLAPTLRAINHIDAAQINDYGAIVISVPMQAVRATLIPFAKTLSSAPLLISTVKGIEISSSHFPMQVLADVFGSAIADRAVVLSGPSFAIEVAQKLPTAVVAASKFRERAELTQKIFHSSFFRVYTSDDPMGLEVAGALKNIVAIAAGACVGLGLQMNSLAAIITRGLAEMTQMGVFLGAKPMTFQGLGGVGDLFLTCMSEKSRNFSLGHYLGQGLSVHEALKKLGSVAEGFTTSKAAFHLAAKLGVDLPITNQVFEVLYNQKPVSQAFQELINRDARSEFSPN